MDIKVPKYYLDRLGVDDNINYDQALNLIKDDFLVVFMYTMKVYKKSFYSTMKKLFAKVDNEGEVDLPDRHDQLKFCKSLSSMITHSLIELESSIDNNYYNDMLSMLDVKGLIRDLYLLMTNDNNQELWSKYKFLIDSVESNSDYLYNKHFK